MIGRATSLLLLAIGCAGSSELPQACSDVYYPDADGDGYGPDHGFVVACEQPEGFVRHPGDCDDGSAAIRPNATDTPADGVDQDCDGSDRCSAPMPTEAFTTCDGMSDLHLDGSLSFSSDVTFATDLSCICSISGNLSGAQFGSFELRMESLISVGGTVSFVYSDLVLDLPNLVSIAGDLDLFHNDIDTLSHLERLSSVGGEIELFDNDLHDIDGLSKITNVLGDLTVVDYELTDLSGLSALESVGGNLDLSSRRSRTSASSHRFVTWARTCTWDVAAAEISQAWTTWASTLPPRSTSLAIRTWSPWMGSLRTALSKEPCRRTTPRN